MFGLFVNSVSISDTDLELKDALPTGKVDKHIRFGGLWYSTYAYFSFIARIETIYCNILSEEYIVALGPNIVDRIRVALKQEAAVSDLFVAFVPPGVSTKCFDDVLNFILLIYA